jgi:signal transduction histidine kinase
VRQLVVRLSLAAAALAVLAVVAVAVGWQALHARAQLRAGAEADLAALTSLAEATADTEALLRGVARTPAGREGRLAVHLTGGTTVGTSRLVAPELTAPPGTAEAVVEAGAADGSVLLRRVPDGPAGPVLVEVFLPADGPAGIDWGRAGLLLGVGGLAAAAGALLAGRRVRPVADDLAALAASARGIGDEQRPLRTRAMHTPETVGMAAALDALADRFAEARAGERRLAADLSHRLRTPLTALRLDAGAIGDGPAAERVRATVESLNDDVDLLIRTPTVPTGPARCDVVAVVRRRMGFWGALAQHSRRHCEFHAVDGPAVTALREDDLAAVFDALMTNIFRYTPDGAGIAVSVVRHAGWITLVVDDAGPGVADPVTALGRGVSSSGSTGLGLDIARDAVEATGGTIHIERSALGGARIRLRFGEVGAEHADPDEPRAWRLWGRLSRTR